MSLARWVFGLCVCVVAIHAACAAESVLRPGDRILVAGDSITGHSINRSYGYCHRIEWALDEADPDNTISITALGGSGHGVGTWMRIATYAGTEPRYLDARDIEIRETLDAGADVLVIMLGMNDLLCPRFDNTPEGIQAWHAAYTNLIETLRVRTHPRVIALGSITLLTEDDDSPMNIARAALNAELDSIAAETGSLVFHTGEATRNLLERGRMLDPDFHVAGDFVHPGAFGHTAMAAAILTGLGEDVAAQRLEDEVLATLIPTNSYPVLSYVLDAVSTNSMNPTNTYTISYWWSAGDSTNTSATVNLALPTGWQQQECIHDTTSGVFTVTGEPSALVNELVLTATSGDIVRTRHIEVPAPWRVCGGMKNQKAWLRRPGWTFSPTNSVHDYDEPLIRGEGFSLPLVADGEPYPWELYTPSVDYTGGNDPASVDPFAFVYGTTFDAVYAARWIHSDHNRSVDVVLSTQTFSATIGLNVWVNGKSCYAGNLTSEPGRTATVCADLEAGWNRLLVKCDHLNWQWQFACALRGRGADDLDDLRYSAIPRGLPSPSPATFDAAPARRGSSNAISGL